MRIIRTTGIKNFIGLILLSVLLVSVCSEYVNILVNSLLPDNTITLTVKNTTLYLLDDANENNLFQYSIENAGKSGIEYRDAEEFGYSWDMLVCYGDDAGTTLTITAPEKNSFYFMFWKYEGAGDVIIESNEQEKKVNLNSEVVGGEILRVYPFEQSMFEVLTKAIIYFLIFIAITSILIGLHTFLAKKSCFNTVMRIKLKKRYIFLIWGLLYLYAIGQYNSGIENYLVLGDQKYYWNLNLFDIPDGQTWVQTMAENTLPFRGYISHLLPSISHKLANWINIDPIHIYLLFTTAAIVWLNFYVFPELYFIVTKTRASVMQMSITLILVLYFWNGILTAVLVDMFGAVAFLTGALFLLKWSQIRDWKLLFVVGLSWSIACNLRTAYQYGIYLMLLLMICYIVRQAGGIKFYIMHSAKKNFLCHKQLLCSIVAAVFGFLVIAFPQFMINKERGHIGFLPYDCAGAWAVEGASEDSSLLEWSANSTLGSVYTGYPLPVSDDQMFAIKDRLFSRNDFIRVPQILNAYASSPLESIQYITKKLLLAFDVKTNITYPQKIDWNSLSGIIFSLLNYFVLISATYTLFVYKKIHGLEKVLFASVAFGLILPQMFVHVEWRYFLASYLCLYYLFAYRFIELRAEQMKQPNDNYLICLPVGILLYFVISFSIYY